MKKYFTHCLLRSFFLLLLISTGAHAQYCIPYSIDPSFGDNIYNFSVTGEAGTFISDLGTPAYYYGYDDRTFESITFYTGATAHTYTVSMSNSGYFSYYGSYAVMDDAQLYIDFNNDFTFDMSTETVGGVTLLATEPATSSVVITIPAGSPAGTFRMRVFVTDEAEAYYPSIDPCGGSYSYFSYFYGEARDYTVVIAPAPTCTAPTANVSAITCTSATLSWGAVAGATGYEYAVSTSATPPTGPGTATVATSVPLTGLTPSTPYYAYVRTNCGAGGFSTWASVPFTTATSTLPLITGGNIVCVGSTLSLSDATAGGLWGSLTTSIATVNSSGVVTGASTGGAIIAYYQGGCFVTTTVTVNPAVSTITGTTTFCKTGNTTLSDATAGGTWSSGNTAVALSAGGGVINGVSAGTATITYATGPGCNATTMVTLDDTNGGTITGEDSICKGSGHTVALIASETGGTWSSSNTTRATVDPATGIVSAASTSGSFNINYVVTNTCGTYTVTHVMYIRPTSRCNTGINITAGTGPQLKVYPNPSNGNFIMSLSSDINEEVTVTVTNIVGQKVKELKTTTNTNTDISLPVAAGVYTLSASTTHGVYIVKVVVQKD